MAWLPNPDPNVADILDQVTHFRLSRSRVHFGDDPEALWWSVLIDLRDLSIDGLLARVGALDLPAPLEELLLIPAAYDPEDRRRSLPVLPVAIYARSAMIEQLNDRSLDLGISALRLGASVPGRFLDPGAQPQELSQIVVPEGVVVQAVLDDGIAIAHDLFRSGPLQSRIHHAQIFDAEPLPGGSSSVGRGLSRSDIETLLADCTFGGMLDEELFYSRSGQVDLGREVFSTVALRRSHGTHVMALACGADPSEGIDSPILCAALPSRIVADTTGVDLLPALALALHILVKQARRFRTATGDYAPVVVNFSYGNTAGPHDGTQVFATLFDHYFGPDAPRDAQGMAQKAWLTLPAGNANLQRLHAVSDDSTDVPVRLELAVQPDDRTPSHVEIWMPEGSEARAAVSVTTPTGAQTRIEARPGLSASLQDAAGQEVARLSCQYVAGRTRRRLLVLSLNPTAHLERQAGLAPAGTWQIEISRPPGESGTAIHVWVRRDESLRGHAGGGRQAFFDNGDYRRFDRYGAPLAVDPEDSACPVRRAGSLSGFACGALPVVVGAYSAREWELSGYSAAGPLNPSEEGPEPPREGPDLVARGDDSRFRRGVLSAGSRSGSWVRLSGTSVAAPQVAWRAAQDIGSFDGSARHWAETVAREARPLRDASPTRSGHGAVPVDRF